MYVAHHEFSADVVLSTSGAGVGASTTKGGVGTSTTEGDGRRSDRGERTAVQSTPHKVGLAQLLPLLAVARAGGSASVLCFGVSPARPYRHRQSASCF